MGKTVQRILTILFSVAGIYVGFKVGVYVQHHFPFLAALLGDAPDPVTAGTRMDTSGTLPLVTAFLGFVAVGTAGSMLGEKLFNVGSKSTPAN